MTDLPPRQEDSRPRWPMILGGLVGAFLLLGAGLGLGWYLFYRPIVNVAVQLPAAPPPPAPPGADPAQVKALEDQIEKQKAANKQIEEQIAVLRERLRADVCTIPTPSGQAPGGQKPTSSPTPPGAPEQAPSGGQKI